MLPMVYKAKMLLKTMHMFSGGLTELSQRLAEQDRNLIAMTNPNSTHFHSWYAVVAVFFIDFVFAGQPQLVNKIMALKNPKDMKKMILTWMFGKCSQAGYWNLNNFFR